MSDLNYVYKSPAGRMRVTRQVAILLTVASFVVMATNFLLIAIVKTEFQAAFLGQPSLAGLTLLEVIIYAAVGVYFAMYLCIAVISLMLIHRLTANTYALGAPTFSSPAWGVGWWFVPIANLFKPYEHLKDVLHRSSHDNAEASRLRRLMLIWWLAWVLYNISSSIGNVVYGDPETAAEVISTSIFGSVELAASVIILWLYVTVLQRLTAMQDDRSRLVNIF